MIWPRHSYVFNNLGSQLQNNDCENPVSNDLIGLSVIVHVCVDSANLLPDTSLS